MATNVLPSFLNVSIKESMLKDGKIVGNTVVRRIADVSNTFERTITCKGGVETTLYEVSTDNTTSGAKFTSTDIRYARVTNRDTANGVRIRIANSGSDEIVLNLNPGESYPIFAHANNTVMSGSAITTYDMLTITSVKATPLSGTDQDVQIFVASK
jgi:hypothetical protein